MTTFIELSQPREKDRVDQDKKPKRRSHRNDQIKRPHKAKNEGVSHETSRAF